MNLGGSDIQTEQFKKMLKDATANILEYRVNTKKPYAMYSRVMHGLRDAAQ